MLSLSLALTLSCSCVFFIYRTDECPHHWNRRGGEAYSDTAPVNPMKSLPDKLTCFLEIDHIEWWGVTWCVAQVLPSPQHYFRINRPTLLALVVPCVLFRWWRRLTNVQWARIGIFLLKLPCNAVGDRSLEHLKTHAHAHITQLSQDKPLVSFPSLSTLTIP